MIEWMFSVDGWIAFSTLFAMEVVLGIDNIVFISILAGKLPQAQQAQARYIGLSAALIMRIGLLFAITWIIGLTAPLVTLFGHTLSGRDLVLLLGGLFLIMKATIEIHHMVEGQTKAASASGVTMNMVIAQIIALDIVFSLDSIITAVGLTKDINIMIAAVIASMLVMLAAATPLSDFVNRHPTTKMLALAFLVMIGATLVANGLGFEIPKGYIYAAMAFSVLVEVLNILSKGGGVSADGVKPDAAIDAIVLRAHRQGASAVQLIGDDTGVARAWIAGAKSILEDRSFPPLDWDDVRQSLEARSSASAKVALDGAAHTLNAVVAPADMRPAAVVTWRRSG